MTMTGVGQHDVSPEWAALFEGWGVEGGGGGGKGIA